MKKMLLLVCLFIIAVAIYFYMQNDITLVEKTQNQTMSRANKLFSKNLKNSKERQKVFSKVKLETKAVEEAVIQKKQIEEQPLSDSEIKELEKYFSRVENAWNQKIRNLFIKKLNLSEQVINTYFSMREGYDEEKARAFKDFHQNMQKEHGDSYSYNASEDQEEFEKKILKGYMKELRSVLGDDEFKKYMILKDQFNETLRNEQDPQKGVLLIEI